MDCCIYHVSNYFALQCYMHIFFCFNLHCHYFRISLYLAYTDEIFNELNILPVYETPNNMSTNVCQQNTAYHPYNIWDKQNLRPTH